MALGAPRNDMANKGPIVLDFGYKAKASLVFYSGALVMKGTDGYLRPAAATAGGRVVGVLDLENHPSLDTTGQADGFYTLTARCGIFPMKIGSSTDAVTIADEGNDVYVLDDQTISRLPGAGRPVAGQLFLVDGTTAWIGIGIRTPTRSGAQQGTAWQGAGSVEAAVASGAVSVNTEITTLNLATGAQALTLANGLFIGQRKTIVVVTIAGSPVGTLTPATPSGFATVTALGAVGDSVELIWAGAGAWYLASSFGCTFT